MHVHVNVHMLILPEHTKKNPFFLIFFTILIERLRDDLSFCRVYLSFITFGCTANKVRVNTAGLWLFEGRQKRTKKGKKGALFAGLSQEVAATSRCHRDISIFWLFLLSWHQISIKNIVKAWKYFLGYVMTPLTYCVMSKWPYLVKILYKGMLSETKFMVFFSSYGEKRNGLK